MIVSINETTKKEIKCLNINGNEETDPAILSQAFNNFFNNCTKNRV